MAVWNQTILHLKKIHKPKNPSKFIGQTKFYFFTLYMHENENNNQKHTFITYHTYQDLLLALNSYVQLKGCKIL